MAEAHDFARSSNSGLIALRLSGVTTQRASIIKLAAQYRLPAVYSLRIFAADGGLISYGPDTVEHSGRPRTCMSTASLRARSLPTLPVQAPTKYEFVINLKTAKALGLTVPQSLLARADEVIE